MFVANEKTIFPLHKGTNMAQPLISDELWSLIEPHIPVKPRRTRNPGRLPVPNRACLSGIVFVHKSGIPLEMLP